MSRLGVSSAGLLVLVWFAGCAHRYPAVDLATGLTLQVVPPSTVIANRQIEVTFVIHNGSNFVLPLCSPSGVTTYLQSDSPAYVANNHPRLDD
jgi:hypothetical protein